MSSTSVPSGSSGTLTSMRLPESVLVVMRIAVCVIVFSSCLYYSTATRVDLRLYYTLRRAETSRSAIVDGGFVAGFAFARLYRRDSLLLCASERRLHFL